MGQISGGRWADELFANLSHLTNSHLTAAGSKGVKGCLALLHASTERVRRPTRFAILLLWSGMRR
jgi:hypothetical protein